MNNMTYGIVESYRNYTQGRSSQNLLMGSILGFGEGFVGRFMGNVSGVHRT